jgi:hypothetical protein
MGGNHHQSSTRKTLWITIVLGALVLAFGLMIYYISSFIRNDHETQVRADNFRFEVESITPGSDESIQIAVMEDQIEIANPEEWKSAEKIFVSIIEHDGLARINTVSMYDPENSDFIEATVKHISDKPPFILEITYPFEKIFSYQLQSGNFRDDYWALLNKPGQQVIALVNIAEGKTRVVDILVNNKSIHQLAE